MFIEVSQTPDKDFFAFKKNILFSQTSTSFACFWHFCAVKFICFEFLLQKSRPQTPQFFKIWQNLFKMVYRVQVMKIYFIKCSPSFALGWFGLRKEFCEFLLDLFPLLREYGNVSYKFSDAILTEANSDSSINSTSSAHHKRHRDNKPLVGNVMYIDMPD